MSVKKIIVPMLLVLLTGCSTLMEGVRIQPGSKFDRSEKYQMSEEARFQRRQQLESCRYGGKNKVYDYLRQQQVRGFDPMTPMEELPRPNNGRTYSAEQEKQVAEITRRNEIRQRARELTDYCKGIDPTKIDQMLFDLNG